MSVFVSSTLVDGLPVSRDSLALMVLLHCAPSAWTVKVKSNPQGIFWTTQLVFVVWQLS